MKQTRSKIVEEKGEDGNLGDGAALVENLVPIDLITAASKIGEAPQALATAATKLVEVIAINSIATTTCKLKS